MNQVKKATARDTQPEFRFADKFLQSNMMRIAKESVAPEGEDTRVSHWLFVAKVSRLFLTVLEALDQVLLDDVKKEKGNVLVINKFLALRQLAEAQLKGITSGSWDMNEAAVNSNEFKESVAAATIHLTTKDVQDAVLNGEVPTDGTMLTIHEEEED